MLIVLFKFIMLLLIASVHHVVDGSHHVYRWTTKVLTSLLVFIMLLLIIDVHHVVGVNHVVANVHCVHVLFQVLPLLLMFIILLSPSIIMKKKVLCN